MCRRKRKQAVNELWQYQPHPLRDWKKISAVSEQTKIPTARRKIVRLIGGSSALNVGLASFAPRRWPVVRAVRAMGCWASIIPFATLTRTVAGLGINNSGVRQIAEAVATGGDSHRIARP